MIRPAGAAACVEDGAAPSTSAMMIPASIVAALDAIGDRPPIILLLIFSLDIESPQIYKSSTRIVKGRMRSVRRRSEMQATMATSTKLPEAIWVRLRQAGLRVTPLRRRLVRFLASSGRWYTPEEFRVAAERAGLRPGRATVSRLFAALLAAGLCRSFPQTTRVTRYVFCTPGHHHHLICLECGNVASVADCSVRVPDRSFAVLEHVVDFFGRCARCQKQITRARGAPRAVTARTATRSS